MCALHARAPRSSPGLRFLDHGRVSYTGCLELGRLDCGSRARLMHELADPQERISRQPQATRHNHQTIAGPTPAGSGPQRLCRRGRGPLHPAASGCARGPICGGSACRGPRRLRAPRPPTLLLFTRSLTTLLLFTHSPTTLLLFTHSLTTLLLFTHSLTTLLLLTHSHYFLLLFARAPPAAATAAAPGAWASRPPRRPGAAAASRGARPAFTGWSKNHSTTDVSKFHLKQTHNYMFQTHSN